MCLDALVADAAQSRAAHLILERDASLESADRRILAAAVRRHAAPGLAYRHADPYEEPMLWVSDMVAWCCYRGGDWMRRAQPIIRRRRELAA